VWRTQGERQNSACVTRRQAFQGGSVMVWGCISLNCKLPLVDIEGNLNAQRYCAEVLQPQLMPHFDDHALADQPIFMQDGATSHSARITRALLDREGVEVMMWPSMSPDMNPIEHIWDHIKRQLNHRIMPINSIRELRDEIHELWHAIPQARIRRLIHSCRRRVGAVIANRGDYTKY
jgi:transposase